MGNEPSLEQTLRETLNHLYKPAELGSSPLIGLLGLQKRANPARALRDVLERAIEALSDEVGDRRGSGQRFCDLLFNRYVQQFTQEAVATQVGVSARQLRREQDRAIGMLAEYLCRQYDVTDRALDALDAQPGISAEPSVDSVDREMERLHDSLAGGMANMERVVSEALETVAPLAEEHGVQLVQVVTPPLSQVAVAPMVLRQAILNLLTTLITQVSAGTVALEMALQRGYVIMQISARPLAEADWDLAKVQAAQRLLCTFGGHLAESTTEGRVGFTVTVPSTEQLTLLAVEDNTDSIQLWQRYLENSRFHLLPVSEPERALDMAIECQPYLIVLDVMMPGMDGWELLTQLRHHSATRAIPVIVCSVLPQQELAFSLGANDFIRKPTTRHSFLDACTRQSAAGAPTSRPRV